ncbi:MULTISPECIES: hypothetical protein [Pseudomonas]|uniref:hypothetical protein n=1 Tax=Pseudomonas TaxID=286 RepID=UPI000483E720|nr:MULTISPECIES: hypothetical protein [Pseudomonas]USX37507.1 hypothetical protein NH673_03930 [Pseudomonas putida]
MKRDELKDSQTESIENTRRLLFSIIATPSKYLEDEVIISCLVSQTSLAKLSLQKTSEDEDIHIFSLSLNTFKQRSEERLPGGFAAIDSLRKSAAQAIHKEKNKPQPKNNRSRDALSQKVEDLHIELDIQKRSNLILLQTLSDVRSKLDGIVSAQDEFTRQTRMSAILKRITAITSLNPEAYKIPAISTATVVPIKPKEREND